MYFAAQPTALPGQTLVSGPRALVKNKLVWFGHSSFKHVDFPRSDGVCCPFSPTFKLTGLVEIANIRVGGELSYCLHIRV